MNYSDRHLEDIYCGGKISLYDKAVEYVTCISLNHPDEIRVELHEQLSCYYGLKSSETKFITDNLKIPTDPYSKSYDDDINKCALIITNKFMELKRQKELNSGT